MRHPDVPEDYVRINVSEDRHGNWYAEAFYNEMDRTFYFVLHETDADIAVGPISMSMMDHIKTMAENIKWARGRFQVIEDQT